MKTDHQSPGACPEATALLPERLMRFTLRDLKAERAGLEGFLALGNEVKRAAEYDEWIASLETYCKQYPNSEGWEA